VQLQAAAETMSERNAGQTSATACKQGNERGCRSRPVVAWVSAALLAVLAAFTALAALDRLCGLGALPGPLQAELRAAAEAVAAGWGTEAPTRYVEARWGQGVVVVPVEEDYDRRRAVELALELDDAREHVEKLMAAATISEYGGTSMDAPSGQVAAIGTLASRSQSKLSDFLAVDPRQAAAILHALGWPWVHSDLRELRFSDLKLTISGRPAVLEAMPPERLSALIGKIKHSSSWPAAYAELSGNGSVTENQLEALRAHLCKQSVKQAFRSPAARKRSSAALAKYGVLTPAQVRTVLAMYGALELVRNGTQAFPALIWLLERQPGLALPLLHRCVKANEIGQQARLAAAALSGPGAEGARRELRALGPFGADALTEAMNRYPAGVRKDAQAILQTIRKQWPQGKDALEVLGSDASMWRKWYESAREVL